MNKNKNKRQKGAFACCKPKQIDLTVILEQTHRPPSLHLYRRRILEHYRQSVHVTQNSRLC